MEAAKSCIVLVMILAVAGAGTTGGLYDKRSAGPGMQDCPSDKYHHHVVLTKPNKQNGHCGGSLLSLKWVITAAHCDVPGLEVILGRHPDRTEERKKVLNTHKYDTPSKVPHDLMLLEIENVEPFPTIALPSPKDCQPPFQDKGVFVSFVDASVDLSTNIKDIAKPTLNLRCGELDVEPCGQDTLFILPDDVKNPNRCHFYAGTYLLCGKSKTCDSAKGASGGSLMKKNQDSMLYGVLACTGQYFCDIPTQFMNICHDNYRQWITTITNL